jgi:phenylpropionate dioxygenase-like ring-hydroxylating dioxygenase large terminal subunit
MTSTSRQQPDTTALIRAVAAVAAASPAAATTLPSPVYWDEDFYAVERAQVLRTEWLPIARVEQVPERHSYLAADLLDEPLIVMRGADEQVRVFSRVCRHRYEDLLGGHTDEQSRHSGCAALLECPYHSWTYRSDGSLAKAIDFSENPAFEKSKYGLHEIASRLWQGFIFVRLDDSDAELDLDELAAFQGGFDFTSWRLVRTIDWGETTVNWKVLVENFLECYHHVGAHRNTLEPIWPMALVEPDAQDGGDHWYAARMKAGPEAAIGEEEGQLIQPVFLPPDPALSIAQRAESLLLARFPTFLLAAAPDVTYWYQAVPTGPDTHQLFIHLLVPSATLDSDVLATEALDAGVELAANFVTEFHAQDAAVNETVQSSLRSRFATGGPLHPQEAPIHRLQQFLAARLRAPQ